MPDFQANKQVVLDYYTARDTAGPATISAAINQYVSNDYHWYGVHPFGEQDGAEAVASAFWQPLLEAWSPVQRRQDIFFAGQVEEDGSEWVCSMGQLLGLFDKPWLGIPPTGKMVFLRYAEFNCVQDGSITRTGFFCDILSVMRQAGVYPLPPQTGASFIYPGPSTNDGELFDAQSASETTKTMALVNAMIDSLTNLNKQEDQMPPPEFLAEHWTDDMIWYGPEGIGASYTIPRYQLQHQYPFRTNLKDKVFNGHIARFAEGNYAGFFGWPNLTNTPTGGFLGLPGNNVRADMRVVDIYRREGDKLAENWVLIDLPYWLSQQGLDVFARLDI